MQLPLRLLVDLGFSWNTNIDEICNGELLFRRWQALDKSVMYCYYIDLHTPAYRAVCTYYLLDLKTHTGLWIPLYLVILNITFDSESGKFQKGCRFGKLVTLIDFRITVTWSNLADGVEIMYNIFLLNMIKLFHYLAIAVSKSRWCEFINESDAKTILNNKK